MLNCLTVSVEQKGRETQRNSNNIYTDVVAGIMTALQKKGTESVQFHVTCHRIHP